MLVYLCGAAPPGSLRRTALLRERRIRSCGLNGHRCQGWHVSPNGKLLVTFNVPSRKNGGTVYSPLVVRELATGKSLVEIHDETFLQFSPDSKLLATVGETVNLYDLYTGKVRHVVPIEENKFRVTSVHFTPNGRLLVMVGS